MTAAPYLWPANCPWTLTPGAFILCTLLTEVLFTDILSGMTRRTAAELAALECFLADPDDPMRTENLAGLVERILAVKPMDVKPMARGAPNIFPYMVIFERICKEHNVE